MHAKNARLSDYYSSASRNGYGVSASRRDTNIIFEFSGPEKYCAPRNVKSIQVEAGLFCFSRTRCMFTRYAYTCTAIVTTSPREWGLYHGYISGDQLDYEDSILSQFIDRAKKMKRENSVAFLFGCNRGLGSLQSMKDSRREAVRRLTEDAGFEIDKLIAIWNNDSYNSSFNVSVEPHRSAIMAECVNHY